MSGTTLTRYVFDITVGTSMDGYTIDLESELKSHEEIINDEFSVIKENKNSKVRPRSHG